MNLLIYHSEKATASQAKRKVNLEAFMMDQAQENIGEAKIIIKRIIFESLKILIFEKVSTQIFLLKCI
jgi:hypothetical protein